ncbi:hypothetical protein FC61_GL002370 [Levilactobacillus brevis ATCC 14869 = DSM 20054]|nr:hypothetical protein QP38_0969 [Levilactobacillus brevis]KRK19562.1 hypothetical protein FC61_GL002370 [Levilactobacillus brevis ATCC 14869 = DSM 20054]
MKGHTYQYRLTVIIKTLFIQIVKPLKTLLDQHVSSLINQFILKQLSNYIL